MKTTRAADSGFVPDDRKDTAIPRLMHIKGHAAR